MVTWFPESNIVYGQLTGFFGAPAESFAWVKVLHGSSPKTPFMLQPRKVFPFQPLAERVPYSEKQLYDAGLLIVSDEFLKLCDQYGVGFTVAVSDEVFTYKTISDEQNTKPEQNFRICEVDEAAKLQREFMSMLKTWVEVNVQNENPGLQGTEIRMVDFMLKSVTDDRNLLGASSSPDFAKRWSVPSGYMGTLSWLLFASAKKREMFPAELLAEKEELMEKYGFRYIW
jgi:hypothetical protein